VKVGEKWLRVEAKHLVGVITDKFTTIKNAIENAVDQLRGAKDSILKMAHEGGILVEKSDVENFIVTHLDELDSSQHYIRYVEMTFADGSARYARYLDGIWTWSDAPFI